MSFFMDLGIMRGRLSMSALRLSYCIGIILLLVLTTGCESPAARFRMNMAFKRKLERLNLTSKDGDKEVIGEISAGQVQDISDILAFMFGTPDDPHMPPSGELDSSKIVDLKLLKLSAGPVLSNQRGEPQGLYREHCAHCHGITGDGAGPTAGFLNPYPRDYRRGTFKFKSTKKGAKPTHDDLKKVLLEGVAGTAMPSFKLLPDQEVESLVHYVRYLAIRGEVERKLIDLAATDLAAEDAGSEPTRFYKPTTDKAELKKQLEPYNELAQEVIATWIGQTSVPVPAPALRNTAGELENVKQAAKFVSVELQSTNQTSIARGKELFYGPIANCYSCHGESGLGDGQKDFYDDWSGELVEKVDPNQQIQNEYVALGALAPRKLVPRNLRTGVYRGGRRPVDLYWRIVNGIDGAQMPAAPMKPDDAGPDVKGLTNQDVWDLINYVLSMPYESISRPALPESHMVKERL
jgi:mono/diheme cytochrome c family protein